MEWIGKLILYSIGGAIALFAAVITLIRLLAKYLPDLPVTH